MRSLHYLKLITILGEFILFFKKSFSFNKQVFKKRRPIFYKNCEFIGIQSLPINTLGSIFIGAVLGYQLYASLHMFQAEGLLGGTVGVTLFRELAPVMSGLMMTSRVGSTMAAHISSQKVNEQVDALELMGIDPIEYLVSPRILASLLMTPIIAVFFALMASFSAYIVSTHLMGLQESVFIYNYFNLLSQYDLLHCLIKSFSFGVLLSTISCYCGLRAYGGAYGVGIATRNTVVIATLSILLMDYILTALLPLGFSILELT